jgi:ribonuclease J
MFVIIVTLDSETGKIRDKIDIISRGFVYLNEAKDLLKDVRKKIREIVENSASKDHTTDWVYVKDNLRNRIGSFLYERTHRRPLILPVVMEV